MCGINGLLLLDGHLAADGNELISRMNYCIRHRGPDDTGIWSDRNEGVYLGHQRLSIIDLSPLGHQPMLDEKGNAIVFNGEIYNYNSIKSQIKNYNFKTESDTEVLMQLYSTKGHAALEQLNGMYSFAFWNK